MSLLSLLLGILSSLAPLAGVDVSEMAAADDPMPVHELVVEPECETPLGEEDDTRMQAALRSRCESQGLQVELLQRRGRQYVLHLSSGRISDWCEYEDVLDDLERVFNERTSLWLLPVHPRSAEIVNDAEMQEKIAAYESEMEAFEYDHAEGDIAPVPPALPERLGAQGYMLVEAFHAAVEDGSACSSYLVLQTPAALHAQGLLVTERDVEQCRHDEVRDVLLLTLSHRGGETCHKLTSAMQLGQDRLAIVLNGTAVCAPVVHAALKREIFINGLSTAAQLTLGDNILRPLPVPVRVVARREVP
ncbi:MAG: hypothetical protein IKA55_04180 [Akkermansia sp.]|nr:hypothetical protein [Akkermansia sp.]